MAIKMRNNIKSDAVCCECEHKQKEVLNMFDLCIGGNIFTICDECNEKLLSKCLSAEVMKNGRVKSQHDIAIMNKRRHIKGFNKASMSVSDALKGIKENGESFDE